MVKAKAGVKFGKENVDFKYEHRGNNNLRKRQRNY